MKQTSILNSDRNTIASICSFSLQTTIIPESNSKVKFAKKTKIVQLENVSSTAYVTGEKKNTEP